MTTYTITDGPRGEVGTITIDDGFDFDVTSDEDSDEYRIVEPLERAAHHQSPDTGSGAGGHVEETWVDATPEEKLERARELFHGTPIDIEEDDTTEKGTWWEDAAPTGVTHKAGKWVPYVGPQGGNGWKNSETGDVVYQDDPPGETLTADDLTDDEMQEIADQLNTNPETVEDILSTAEPEDDSGGSGGAAEASRGDVVTFEDEAGIEQEGTVVMNDGDWAEIDMGWRTAEVPSEDINEVTDETDMGDDPPEHLDPDNAEEVRPFEEYIEDEFGIEKGVTSDQMEVATMPDGSEVFVSEPPEDPSHHMHNRMLNQNEKDNMGHSMLEAIGANHPEWHYNGATGAVMTEGIDGVTLRTTSDDFEADEDSLVDTMAAQVLIGNGDMHQGNFVVDDDGEVIPVDVDHSTNAMNAGVETTINNAARQVVATQHDETSPYSLGNKVERGNAKVSAMEDRIAEEVAETAREKGDDMLEALEDAGADEHTMKAAREWIIDLKRADR